MTGRKREREIERESWKIGKRLSHLSSA